jgi:hypothetical protein
MGRNDFTQQIALATVQANMITIWKLLAGYGIKTWQTTIAPHTSSTDAWATIGNQTILNPSTDNAPRITFNNWVRDGAPMLAGVAVAAGSNATGTLRAGQSGHPLAGYMELADVVESSRDSGYWRVDKVRTVTDGSFSDVSIFTNKYTLNSATANFTSADVGLYVSVSGAGASGGLLSTGFISKAVSTTQAIENVAAQTTVSGATVNIGMVTSDGVHPGPGMHALIAPNVPVASLN